MVSMHKHNLLLECGVQPNPLTDYSNTHRRKYEAIAGALLGAGTVEGKSLCIVCLKRSSNCGDLLDNYEIFDEMFTSSMTLLNIMREVFASKIQVEDFTRVCDDCIQGLIKLYIFMKRYQINNHILQSSIQELYVKIPNEVSLIETRDNSKRLMLKFESNSERTIHTSQAEKVENKIGSSRTLKIKGFECSMCAEDFYNEQDLSQHRQVHSSDATYICRKDGNIFQTYYDWKRHTKRCHGIKQDYVCPKCGKLFKSNELLNRHLQVHNSRFNCKKCHKYFLNKSLFLSHSKVHAEPKKIAVCEVCGKICKSSEHLRTHKNMHQTKQCPHCNKYLKTHAHFKFHVQKHETGVGRKAQYRTTYTCANCEYKSFNKKSLEAHINKVHLKVRPYACSDCNKAFYKQSNLIEHRVVHTKIKLECCQICAEKFVNKKCLTEHMRLHSGERPYPCSVCNEAFASAGRRLEHEKRKHFEKSEQCSVCGKKFSLRKELNRHMNKVHLKETEQDKLDGDYIGDNRA